MKNLVQAGDTITVIAPANLTSGQAFMIGAIFAIACSSALSGQEVEAKRKGAYNLPKVEAQAWEFGDRIYFDAATGLCTNVSTGGALIGAALADAADPSGVGFVVLNGTIADLFEGSQEAIADIATANATDLATAQTLANQCKATINTLLGELRIIGLIQ